MLRCGSGSKHIVERIKQELLKIGRMRTGFRFRCVTQARLLEILSAKHSVCLGGNVVVGSFGELVLHLEGSSVGQLLDIFEAGKPGILQHAGVTPGPLADLGRVHREKGSALRRFAGASGTARA
jgi:hypothetical protein